jgi:Uncharacterized conserved protein
LDQTNLNENVDTLFKSLENFTQTEGIIGKPVTQGSKTFLPVVSITLGYGGGNSSMKSQSSGSTSSNTGTGSGAGALGLGAKLCTDAIIVLDGQNVFMMPVNSPAAGGNLVDKIPQIISGISQGMPAGQQKGQQQGQQSTSSQSNQQGSQYSQSTQYGQSNQTTASK